MSLSSKLIKLITNINNHLRFFIDRMHCFCLQTLREDEKNSLPHPIWWITKKMDLRWWCDHWVLRRCIAKCQNGKLYTRCGLPQLEFWRGSIRSLENFFHTHWQGIDSNALHYFLAQVIRLPLSIIPVLSHQLTRGHVSFSSFQSYLNSRHT